MKISFNIKVILATISLITLLIFSANFAAAAQSDYRWYLKAGQKSPKWNEFVEPGFGAFDSGNLATSYMLLKKAYDLGCRDGLVLYRIGIYKETQGAYQEAAALFAEAVKRIHEQYPSHPLSVQIHEHAGRAFYKIDEYDRALPELKSAIEANPKNFTALFMAGQILRIKKENSEAKQLLERALAVAPSDKSGGKNLTPSYAGATPSDTGMAKEIRIRLLNELMMVTYELREWDTCGAYADELLGITPGNPSAITFKKKIEAARKMQKGEEAIKKLVK